MPAPQVLALATRDGARAIGLGDQIGTWDPVSGSYVTLPKSYSRTVQRAMEMATRMRPVQLLSLPLGRIGQ